MLCPMKMSVAGWSTGYDKCDQEECAWWNKLYGRCVINSLDSIAYSIDELSKRIAGESG